MQMIAARVKGLAPGVNPLFSSTTARNLPSVRETLSKNVIILRIASPKGTRSLDLPITERKYMPE
jgi:hypothetical protein